MLHFYSAFFLPIFKKYRLMAALLLCSIMAPVAYAHAFQQNGKIAGKVVDEKGLEIPGATVRIANTTTGTQTSIDGTYTLTVKPGTYTVEISFISYQTKQVTGVVVKSGDITLLTVTLMPQTQSLKEVVVTATYSKASADGLYTKQKNAASITNGISAEQIAKTPDANVGQSLKRISGLSTFDNKYVIVRGISERYNVATLDGTPLPSTDYSRRNFSFDLIPSEMIENVTVVKTVTPDLPVGFAGGLVQVNTRDIPVKNFVNFSISSGGNDQALGKELLSTKRGKYDYFGFDDGSRKMVPYLRVSDGNSSSGNREEFSQTDFDFSRQFTNNWKLYRYKVTPNQNYTFSLGQSYDLKHSDRIGFIASINYRNTQSITDVQNKRDLFAITQEQDAAFAAAGVEPGHGKVYNFNTTYGGILNVGYRSAKHQISIRNNYSRIFNNPLIDVVGYDNDKGGVLIGPQYSPSTERIVTEPDFLSLLQNKIQGEHQVGEFKLTWDVSRTAINRERKDMLRRQLENDNQIYGLYFHDIVDPDGVTVFPLSRQQFFLSETDYNWTTSVSRQINKSGAFANILKVGYIGFSKKQNNKFVTAYLRPTDANAALAFNSSKSQIEDVHNDDLFGPGKLSYQITAPFGLNEYQGSSSFHAGYAMIDQKLWSKLRFIGGVRVEYFKLFLINDAISSINSLLPPGVTLVPSERDKDKQWQFLPSANLTYSLTDQINLRAAYSQAMVRPEFNERSLSSNFNSDLQADVTGSIVVSTKTNSYDFRAEWFPGAGEVISIGSFYKYLQRPLELVRQNAQALYIYNNSEWAKSYGIEGEIRKNLGFINDRIPLLSKFVVFSNATILASKVQAVYSPRAVQVDPENNPYLYQLQYEIDKQKRPLYGQTPFLLNAGLEYNGDIIGFNIVHNHTGRKFYILTSNISLNEYEAPYDQTDIQLNANVLKRKGKIRFNMGNVFNTLNFFYNSQFSYENVADGDPTQGKRLKRGFTDGYEKGDFITFKRRTGRTFMLSFSYTF